MVARNWFYAQIKYPYTIKGRQDMWVPIGYNDNARWIQNNMTYPYYRVIDGERQCNVAGITFALLPPELYLRYLQHAEDILEHYRGKYPEKSSIIIVDKAIEKMCKRSSSFINSFKP
ncbi:hypothetical protein EV175_000310 [Coemansia sp. RSA 1933]|nr:hypothetical protein EV175_000310 [Coemansia sp. RSA 1933]